MCKMYSTNNISEAIAHSGCVDGFIDLLHNPGEEPAIDTFHKGITNVDSSGRTDGADYDFPMGHRGLGAKGLFKLVRTHLKDA